MLADAVVVQHARRVEKDVTARQGDHGVHENRAQSEIEEDRYHNQAHGREAAEHGFAAKRSGRAGEENDAALAWQHDLQRRLDEEEAGRFHRATLSACDGVVVYFGDVRRSWVETRLRDLLKAPGFGRSAPFAAKAVYITPGGDLQKQRFRTHLADVVNAQTRLDSSALGPFVERLKISRAALS